MEIQNNEVIVGLLKQGFGCSLVSERAVEGISSEIGRKLQAEFLSHPTKTSASDDIVKCGNSFTNGVSSNK